MATTSRTADDSAPEPLSPEEEAAYAGRKMVDVLWIYLEGVRRKKGFDAGTPFTSLARMILSCPRDETDLADAIAVAIVNGRMVHGLAPRNPGEWSIAERIYERWSIDELEEWAEEQGIPREAPDQSA